MGNLINQQATSGNQQSKLVNRYSTLAIVNRKLTSERKFY